VAISCDLGIPFGINASSTTPTVAQKYPRAYMCRPQ
jgi:hypothetical protein